jgi:D-lactate dehydrogenase
MPDLTFFSPPAPPCPLCLQVDFHTDDPIEMIKRLMIGSEGTLGFVSQATYNTVPEWPHKASAFVIFPDVMSACQGASGG